MATLLVEYLPLQYQVYVCVWVLFVCVSCVFKHLICTNIPFPDGFNIIFILQFYWGITFSLLFLQVMMLL